MNDNDKLLLLSKQVMEHPCWETIQKLQKFVNRKKWDSSVRPALWEAACRIANYADAALVAYDEQRNLHVSRFKSISSQSEFKRVPKGVCLWPVVGPSCGNCMHWFKALTNGAERCHTADDVHRAACPRWMYSANGPRGRSK